jgi:hypothetical protein
MSIRQFGAEELGNLVSLIANGMVSPGTREPAAEQLHHVSVANTWAYNKQYRQRAEPAATAAILRYADGPPNVHRACLTASLLRYNCYTLQGETRLQLGEHEALVNVLDAVVGALHDVIEHLERALQESKQRCRSAQQATKPRKRNTRQRKPSHPAAGLVTGQRTGQAVHESSELLEQALGKGHR